jgi:hypothetical protein
MFVKEVGGGRAGVMVALVRGVEGDGGLDDESEFVRMGTTRAGRDIE